MEWMKKDPDSNLHFLLIKELVITFKECDQRNHLLAFSPVPDLPVSNLQHWDGWFYFTTSLLLTTVKVINYLHLPRSET